VLYESSHDAIMTLAPPSWKFTAGNPTILEMFNVKDEAEFVTLGPWDLSPEMQPDGRPSTEKAKEKIGKAMEEGSNFFEWTHKRLNGEDFPATVQLTRTEVHGQTFLQATVRDITERKKAEDALKDRTNALGERVKEMRCLYTVTRMMADPDISQDALMDRTVEVIPPSWRHPDICCARIRIKDKEHRSANWKDTDIKLHSHITVKGKRIGIIEVVYLEDRSTNIGGPFMPEERQLLETIATLLGDFVERRTADEAIKESEERYRTLFEKSPDGILIIEPDGTLRDCNEGLANIMGKKRVDLVGKTFMELGLVNDELLDEYIELFEKMLMGEAVPPMETMITGADGKDLWLEVLTAVIKKGGEISSIQTIIRDVTDRKKEESKQKELLIKLEEEMAELESMLKPMSEKPFKPGVKDVLEPGNCYIVLEPKNEGAIRRFMDHVSHGHQGLFITRKNPVPLRTRLDLQKTPFIWLTNNEHEEELCIIPTDIQKLASAITSFLDKSENGIVLFTGLEYMAAQNGFKSLMNLLYLLNDRVMVSDDILIASVNPKAYLPQDLHLLTSEFTLIDRGFEDLTRE